MKTVASGEGYLLAAKFMQYSVVMDKMLAVGEVMGFPREVYRKQLMSVQGSGPWMVCEECIGSLNLSQPDKDAAREAAKRWWTDKTTPGYYPGTGGRKKWWKF